nr:MAG: replication initiator protein [Microvirus sp.]
MVCYHPIEGYRAPGGQVVFAKRHGWSDLKVSIPCSQCIGCRLEKSRQWAMRIMHESSLYEDNVFLTLTYRDADLPENDSLDVRDWQLFMKRLKKRHKGRKIRFYQCGEYGETTHRPHHHAILFDFDFKDKKFLKYTETKKPLYTSSLLDEIWKKGDCYIGDVTFESAAYCGRYVMKKLTGARKSEYGSRAPEDSTMSRNPGIGKPWLDKWEADVFPLDFCIVNGKKVKVPKYYDTQVSEKETPLGHWAEDYTSYPIWMPDVKRTVSEHRRGNRKRNAVKHSDDNTSERLAVREEIQRLRIERLTRS